MAASSLVIKVKYGETLRRLTASIHGNALSLSIVMLKEKIRRLLSFGCNVAFTMTYVDEDGDVVILATDDDLRDILGQSLIPLRITVNLSNGTPGGSSVVTTCSAPVTLTPFQLQLQQKQIQLQQQLLRQQQQHLPQPSNGTPVGSSVGTPSAPLTLTSSQLQVQLQQKQKQLQQQFQQQQLQLQLIQQQQQQLKQQHFQQQTLQQQNSRQIFQLQQQLQNHQAINSQVSGILNSESNSSDSESLDGSLNFY